MAFAFSKRSRAALAGVHADLVVLATATLCNSPADFGVTQGLRTPAQQHQYFLAGTSQLDEPPPPGKLRGRHLTGHAIDILVYENGVATEDEKFYPPVIDAFKAMAKSMGISIICGLDNPHWIDAYHIELDRAAYPDAPLVA